MSAIELLPCPFCGSHGIDRELTRLRPYPYCTNCGASGPIMKVTWNDRTRTDLSQASVAAALEAAAKVAAYTSDDRPMRRGDGADDWSEGYCEATGEAARRIRALITPAQHDARPAPQPAARSGKGYIAGLADAARALGEYCDSQNFKDTLKCQLVDVIRNLAGQPAADVAQNEQTRVVTVAQLEVWAQCAETPLHFGRHAEEIRAIIKGKENGR